MIAFITTVVGLANGLTAYVIYTVRKRWIEDDIRNLEFIAELLTSSEKGERSIEISREKRLQARADTVVAMNRSVKEVKVESLSKTIGREMRADTLIRNGLRV